MTCALSMTGSTHKTSSPQEHQREPRQLLIVTAVIEVSTGLALLVSPSLTVSILIGAPFEMPADSVVGRVAGAALLALGYACWRARDDGLSSSTRGLVSAILIYNLLVAFLLAYAGTSLRLFGIALWPAVGLHLVMAIWCLAIVLMKRV